MRVDKRIIYAANREIGIQALEMLVDNGIIPVLILTSDDKYIDGRKTSKILSGVPIISGDDFRKPESINLIKSIKVDYIISVHFPYIIPGEVLRIPRVGTLNLHPAFLPYNRGWHTPTWAILDCTPFGATLHWMDEGIDTGDIAIQKRIDISPGETTHSLYQRILKLELEIFNEAIPLILNDKLPRIPQVNIGTIHRKSDLKNIQKIDMEKLYTGKEIINLLRALTTNDINEAAYFEVDGNRYMITVKIIPRDN